MSAPKRKRGRPKKPRPIPHDAVWQSIPFEKLPEREISSDERDAIARAFRDYLTKRPNIVDRSGEMQKWLDATADALALGDPARVAYYALFAMRMRGLLAYQEPQLVDGIGTRGLWDLAETGKQKLRSDRRRGRRVKW